MEIELFYEDMQQIIRDIVTIFRKEHVEIYF